MTGNRISLGSGDDALAMELRFSSTPGKNATRAQWDVIVQDKSGKRLMTQSYRSFLPDDVSTRAVAALAEAATLSVLGEVHQLVAAPETAAVKQP